MPSFESSDQTNSAIVEVQTTSTVLAVARTTRRSLTLVNRDAANPIHIAVDTAAVAASHFQVKAGESFTLSAKGEIRAIAVTAAVNVHIWDEYD